MRLASGAVVLSIGCMASSAWAQPYGAYASAGALANPCVHGAQEGYVVPSAHVVAMCNGDEETAAAAESSIDLRTGILLVSYLAHSNVNHNGANAGATVDLVDHLNFQVPDGLLAPGESLPIDVSFALDGSVTGDAMTSDPLGFLLYRFAFADRDDFSEPHFIDLSGAIESPTSTMLDFPEQVLVRSPYRVEVIARLDGRSIQEGGVSYTGTIAMGVPAGVTWTSETGAFLAPEASSALGGAGVLFVFAALRATRRRAA